MFVQMCVHYNFSSYLPALVHHLGIGWENVGYHVGKLNLVWSISAALGNAVFGIVLVYCSTKKCLVILNAILGASLILFGFSSSLSFSYLCIALVGIGCSGTIATKEATYLICDSDNQKNVALWTYGAPIMVGMSFGPFISGVLANPTQQYPNAFEERGIFGRYPALLVNLVFGCSMLILSAATQLVFPADQHLSEYLSSQKAAYFDRISVPKKGYRRVPEREKSEYSKDIAESSDQTDLVDTSNVNEAGTSDHDSSLTLLQMLKIDVLFNPTAIGSILLFTVFAATIGGYQALWPLWLQTPHELRGRGYGSNQVSIIMLCSGSILIVVNFTVIQRFNKVLTLRSIFAVSILTIIPIVNILPLLSEVKAETAFCIILVLLNGLALTAFSSALGVIHVFLKICAKRRATSLVLALAQLVEMSNYGLTIFVVASVYTSSITTYWNPNPFPIDYHLAFYLTSLLFICSALPWSLIPEDIEERRP